jgi:hypothetical protein
LIYISILQPKAAIESEAALSVAKSMLNDDLSSHRNSSRTRSTRTKLNDAHVKDKENVSPATLSSPFVSQIMPIGNSNEDIADLNTCLDRSDALTDANVPKSSVCTDDLEVSKIITKKELFSNEDNRKLVSKSGSWRPKADYSSSHILNSQIYDERGKPPPLQHSLENFSQYNQELDIDKIDPIQKFQHLDIEPPAEEQDLKGLGFESSQAIGGIIASDFSSDDSDDNVLKM